MLSLTKFIRIFTTESCRIPIESKFSTSSSIFRLIACKLFFFATTTTTKFDRKKYLYKNFFLSCNKLIFFNESSTVTGSNNSNINGNNSNGPTNPTNVITSSNSLSSSFTNGINGIQDHQSDWICFNFGKELYTYAYRGVKKVCSKYHLYIKLHPIQKRINQIFCYFSLSHI